MIITTENYILEVNDLDITKEGYVYKDSENPIERGIFYIPSDIDFDKFNKKKKDVFNIIKHLPLNNSINLPGVETLKIED
jgi:hypothetical protein